MRLSAALTALSFLMVLPAGAGTPSLPKEVVAAIVKDSYAGVMPAALTGRMATWRHVSIDLNADGKPDFLIEQSDPEVCGSGGCALLIYVSSPYGYRSAYSGPNFYSECSASKTVTNGFRDLVFNTSSGRESFLHLLKYDGREYREAPHR